LNLEMKITAWTVKVNMCINQLKSFKKDCEQQRNAYEQRKHVTGGSKCNNI